MTSASSLANLAAGMGKIDVSWYQPKWQKNDFYKYNFRINYADSVIVKYCSFKPVVVTPSTPVITPPIAPGLLTVSPTPTAGPIATGMLPVVLPQGV